MMTDVKKLLSENAELTEKFLVRLFDEGIAGDTLLAESARYSVLGGGR